ncbi:hypothetical protein RHSIM_Rhsim06G0026700 [Rhododendron simsii]|uniref:Uncharacterized protein n=1 Tax=Rhododendron simsii TaxID=118357 RepID=A0A834H425_RHOSS|nr:hypothetical protein RHSIM_Rhsim06G0026700 [Rhododendron simsii]
MLELSRIGSRIGPHGDQLSKRGHLSFTQQGHIAANCSAHEVILAGGERWHCGGGFYGVSGLGTLGVQVSSGLDLWMGPRQSQASKLEAEEYSSEGSFEWGGSEIERNHVLQA